MINARLRGQTPPSGGGRARLILDTDRDAFTNMAADEALFGCAPDTPYPVTLRIYGWSRPAVSLGRRQKISETATDACRRYGLDIVKRIGGGGVVYHDREITYCFVSRIGATYGPACAAKPRLRAGNEPDVTGAKAWRGVFSDFLNRLGLKGDPPADPNGRGGRARTDLCFTCAETDEPTLNGRKWVGSARRKSKGVFLQHGSILLKPQPAYLGELMPSHRAGPDISAGLTEFVPGLSREEAAELFIASVEKKLNLGFKKDGYTEVEKSSINGLKILKEKEIFCHRRTAIIASA